MGQHPTWGQTTEDGGSKHTTHGFHTSCAVTPCRSKSAVWNGLAQCRLQCSIWFVYLPSTLSLLFLQKHSLKKTKVFCMWEFSVCSCACRLCVCVYVCRPDISVRHLPYYQLDWQQAPGVFLLLTTPVHGLQTHVTTPGFLCVYWKSKIWPSCLYCVTSDLGCQSDTSRKGKSHLKNDAIRLACEHICRHLWIANWCRKVPPTVNNTNPRQASLCYKEGQLNMHLGASQWAAFLRGPHLRYALAFLSDLEDPSVSYKIK